MNGARLNMKQENKNQVWGQNRDRQWRNSWEVGYGWA